MNVFECLCNILPEHFLGRCHWQESTWTPSEQASMLRPAGLVGLAEPVELVEPAELVGPVVLVVPAVAAGSAVVVAARPLAELPAAAELERQLLVAEPPLAAPLAEQLAGLV